MMGEGSVVSAAWWALWSAVVAGALAFFVLGFVHWAVERMVGGRVPRLVCYALGLGCVVVIDGVWALVQVGELPAVVGWMALCWICLWAGLGTLAGWVLDGLQGRRVVEGVRRGQSRAATDRNS